MTVKKGRLCCPHDQSPLFSVVKKNLKEYNYSVRCKNVELTFMEINEKVMASR